MLARKKTQGVGIYLRIVLTIVLIDIAVYTLPVVSSSALDAANGSVVREAMLHPLTLLTT
jgi:hypothetical protein